MTTTSNLAIRTEANEVLFAVYLKGPEDETWEHARAELGRRGFRLSYADRAMDRLIQKLARQKKDASQAAWRFTSLRDPGLAPGEQN